MRPNPPAHTGAGTPLPPPVGLATPHAPPVGLATPHAPPRAPVNAPPPSNLPVPTASSLPTPVNVLVQPGASARPAAAPGEPISQSPATLVHPLGGSSPPVAPVSQPPRPSYAPQTLPSGAAPATTDARVRELQAQVVRARQELIAAQVELRTARGDADNLRAELNVAKARIEELEAEALKAKSAAITVPGEDLKVIKGIGPKFEKLLRSAGVTSLLQIAAWSDGDVDAIAKKLGIKAERIRKDDWVGNAKRLATGA
jgi:predicted flap endonuclease-1-like 5' DNA nuclease